MVTAFVCEKGGVGKTTSVVNGGVALASEGHRVLVLDLDQGHAGKALGAARDTGPGIADIVHDGAGITNIIRAEPRVPGIDVVAGSRAMADFDLNLASSPDRLDVIRQAIEPVRDAYDHVLLDLPPGRGLVQVGSYMAADWVLVPVVPEADAIEGLVDLDVSIRRAASELGAPARLLGVLLTQVDLRTREHRDNIGELREALGTTVFDTIVRSTTRVREASRERLSVMEYAPNCTAALDYRAAALEMIDRMDEGG